MTGDALHTTFHGIGVSAGTAVGPLVIVTPAPKAPTDEAPTTDAAAAADVVRGVLEDVAVGLEARAAKASEHARPILEAGAMKGTSQRENPAGAPRLRNAILVEPSAVASQV